MLNKHDKNKLLVIVNDDGQIDVSNFTAKQREKAQKLLDKFFKDWSVKNER